MDWTDWMIWFAVVLVVTLLVAILLDEAGQPLNRKERRQYAKLRRRMNEHDEAAEARIDAERVAAQAWDDWQPEQGGCEMSHFDEQSKG